MAALKEFKTIPDLFEHITQVFGKTQSKPALMYKKDGKYVGISYSEFMRRRS